MAWEILDYNVVRLASQPSPNDAGLCTITFATVPVGQVWLVSGIAIRCPSLRPVSCVAYDLDPSSVQFIEGGTDPIPNNGPVPCGGSYAGNFDIDDGSALIITGGNALSLVFTGVDLGVAAKARVQYAVAQRAGKSAAQPILGAPA
jgi:hypothetical protein